MDNDSGGKSTRIDACFHQIRLLRETCAELGHRLDLLERKWKSDANAAYKASYKEKAEAESKYRPGQRVKR